MANAWCINAIWFDWTLIQTLQQLDSANIWVWIQYTAPSPLDDKRLDYIKYTDKCWNTCCITWENELLIYATQWVIKNLTLTNDDANEVVNVKRNDIFWSNWKKTVVRYKTWSFPTSITDWTLAVEETTMNQYASTWYNVSWLSDWTTYYFSAFAVAQDDTIIVVQTKSITTDFARLPTEYQEVEYITSSWTQYINTWLQASSTLSFDFTITPNTSYIWENAIFWNYRSERALFMMFFSSKYRLHNWWRVVDWPTATSTKTTITVDNTWYTINWTKYNCATQNNYWWSATISLFATTNWQSVNTRWHFSLREMKISDNWTLVRDFIPCYRKSDNVVWLYDLTNNVFYTNAWSWSFTKWPDV